MCSWLGRAHVDLDAAKAAAWEHCFPNRISDLRIDAEQISSNGKGEVVGGD